MLFVSLRDLQWRRRRFMIGVLATGLVFALALIITGISASFHNEVGRAVRAFGVDGWLVSKDTTGPFTSSSAFPAAMAEQVAEQQGIRAAEPVAMLRFTTPAPALRDINVIGITPGGIVKPALREGAGLQASGDVIVDSSLGLKIGEKFTLSGTRFTVVGITKGLTYYAGTPMVWMAIADGQKIALGGVPLATSIAYTGSLRGTPTGLRSITNAQAIADLRRPLKKATETIDFLRLLLWIVAAGIIGSVLYLQAIERTRDFAVFKATGVTGRTLLIGLALQAVVLALAAAATAIILGRLIAPAMSMDVEIPASTYILLPIVAVVVGLVASVFGVRRAVAVDPASAFGG